MVGLALQYKYQSVLIPSPNAPASANHADGGNTTAITTTTT